MLGYAFANVTKMRRFIQPGTKQQAQYDHFLLDCFGLVWGAGAIVESAPRRSYDTTVVIIHNVDLPKANKTEEAADGNLMEKVEMEQTGYTDQT